MQASPTSHTGRLSGEFLTRTFRISGEVAIRGEPLLDRLNDQNALFVTLENMYVSPLLDPAVLTGNFKSGEVRKDRLGLVVLHRDRDGFPQRAGRYSGRDFVDNHVMLVCAGFEIAGTLPLHRSVNVPNFVRTTTEQFIPIFNAKATLNTRREVVYEGGAILINRARLEVFALQDAIID